MGWTCQYDFQGYCKLVKKQCEPGMKGCILKQDGFIFSSGSYEEDKKAKEEDKKEQVDFAALARSN